MSVTAECGPSAYGRFRAIVAIEVPYHLMGVIPEWQDSDVGLPSPGVRKQSTNASPGAKLMHQPRHFQVGRLLARLPRTFCPLIAAGMISAAPAHADSTSGTEVSTATAVLAENLDASAPAQPSSSSATGSNDNSNGWEVTITPYVWATGLTIDVDTPQGEQIELDDSFTDILSNIKFVGMGALEARHGRLILLSDLIFLSTGSSEEGDFGPGLVEVEGDTRTLISTNMIGYRVVDQAGLAVDLMAGARITSLKIELELSGPLQTVERESSETKVGPVIASRFRVPLGGKWAAALYGDLGGFGVTSDLSWQLLGTIQYEISDHWSAGGGWRYVAAEQNKDGFDVDLVMSGPFLAFRYRF